MFPSIWWRITIPYTVIILLATLGLTLYLSSETRDVRMEDLAAHLQDEAWIMANALQASMTTSEPPDVETLNRQVREWAALLDQRVTLVGADGTVLGESHADYRDMENHLLRPEIQRALVTGTGSATRFSQTLRMRVMYVAVAIKDRENVVGYVRVALPVDEVNVTVNRQTRTLLISGGVAAFVAIAMATLVAYRTISPVRRLTEAVERAAAGDLSARLLPTSRDEVGQLTRSFNHMADQLQEKVATLGLERARLSAVLEHMADGVIITDEAGVIVMINAAAARILRYDDARAIGRRFAQVAYSHQLVELWNRCYETGEEANEIVETPLFGTFLNAVITPLEGSAPPRFLVMLQDLTHIRRLETVRRDFISNISHELRTPLASLSLVVETLRDGAIEDPPAARRFLSHMETELASLTQMVEELLELSRIESGRVPLSMKATRVRKLLRKPVERLRPQAERRKVAVTLVVPDDLPRVRADAKRIHQVVTNLVHNAIKFTPVGGAITVFARLQGSKDTLGSPPEGLETSVSEASEQREAQAVIIGVTDTGVGIPEGDLPRIFERFYKTDRARAQEGTGLGLAIAKHIVQGHGGSIWVESREGVGSTFFFTLPVAEAGRATSEL
ncbi:MAG: ATP-binding protein [Anaerolineae bacterium]